MATKSTRGATTFVLVTVVLDTLGMGLIIPVGPRLIGSFLGNDIAKASYYFGLQISLYAVMQFLFAPMVGGLSDRFGRRPIILLSLFGATASYLLSAFAPTLAWLFVGRALSGMAGASYSAASAYVADVTPADKRAQSFGLLGAGMGLGYILGPAMGGILGHEGIRIPYFVAAALNSLNMLYGIFVLPESLPQEHRRKFSWARANPLGALRVINRYPIVRGLIGTLVCQAMAQRILQSVWALHTQARFDWTVRQIGWSMMFLGFGAAIVQGGVVRIVAHRMGDQRMLVVGLIMSILGFMVLGGANQGWLMLAGVPILSLAALAPPAAQAIISRAVDVTEQGEIQGAVGSLNGIAAIAGPLVGTALIARFSPITASPRIPGAAFFAAAAFNVLGLILVGLVFARRGTLTGAARKPPVGTAVEP